MNDYGGRRFLLVVGCTLTYTLLLIWGLIDQDTYSNLQLWTVAAYIAGNNVQKFTDKRYGSQPAK